MTPTLRLFGGILYKKGVLMVRYPVDSVGKLLTQYAFFLAIFLGGQAINSQALTNSLEGIIVGYMLFSMATVTNGGLAWAVTSEAQWGTLEQLFMTPFGFSRLMAIRTVVNVLFSLFWGLVVLALMLLTTGRTLNVDPVTLLPLAFLAVSSVAGIGFLFAGLALVYKRVQNVFTLVKFGFAALIAAPVEQIELLKLAPLAVGSHLLRIAMRDGLAIWELPLADLGLLGVTAIGYPLLGLGALGLAQRHARRKGILGDY